MANDLSINVGSTWKSIDNCQVNVGSAWKQVIAASVNVGGTWKQVWPVVTVSGESITHLTASGGEAGVRFNTDGTVDRNRGNSYDQIDSTTDWIIPNSAGATVDHWIRFKYVSGDTADFAVDGGAGALNTWYQLGGAGGSNHEIDFTSATAKSGVYSVEIATDSGGTNIVAGPTNYTLTITYI